MILAGLLMWNISTVLSDQNLRTKDGKAVILRNDGTWVYDTIATNPKTNTSPCDFRNSHWGDARASVKSVEAGDPLVDKDDILIYECRLANMDAGAAYIFVDNKLVRGKYMLRNPHTNNNDYIADYMTLLDLLKRKYGEPNEDKTIWKDDLYKNDATRWGMAVATGGMIKYAKWRTHDTNVILMIMGDNYSITLGIEYGSVELQDLEREKKEGNILDDL